MTDLFQNRIPRDVGQLLISKLDMRAVTLKDAKAHAARYGVTIQARTADKAAREIGRAMVQP